MNKAFRSKLLEFCKTRTTKSSPEMFNFYVVFAGQNMVTDAGRITSCRRKFKTSWLRTKIQKMKEFSKTWVLTGKQLEDIRQKKTETKI